MVRRLGLEAAILAWHRRSGEPGGGRSAGGSGTVGATAAAVEGSAHLLRLGGETGVADSLLNKR